MKILNLFGKPETAPVHLGTDETRVSFVRLDKIDVAVDLLSQAFETISDEKEPKTVQTQLAAEAFQGAVRLARNSERAATTVVEATAQTDASVTHEIAQNHVIQTPAPEKTAQQAPAPAPESKEARVAAAQANLAAILEKGVQK